MTDREKLIELVSGADLPMKNDGRIIAWYALEFHEALYMADHLIANDVVSAVRCGKCKHWDPDSGYCQFWHGVRHPGHYCGEGERKIEG